MRYIVGSVLFIIGIIGMFRPLWITSMMGRNAWAEQHMGTSGGSSFFYRVLGILLFVFSLLFMLFKWPA